MSTRSRIAAVTLALALAGTASSSQAREIYISPMAGYTTAGNLELGQNDAKDVKVTGGLTWGGQIGFMAHEGFTFEASYMQQESHLSVLGVDRIGLKVGQLHGNFLFEKIRYGSNMHPYFLLGLGATFFNPDRGFDTVSRFSLGLGGGVKVEGEKIGLKLQAKYNPTYLNDDWGGTWCDPF
ncbi:MAG TPA: hypothetical protein VJX91_09820, partial [Candidatus Eisenbacteria bacterium]|nr:hypothetical protein [Candidatus Eisenbacteria bacterium]